MKYGKKIAEYMLPVFLTAVILGVVMILKGIYPFGNHTVDYYDMGQQIAPFYYHVYDALHGEKSLLFDWYSALGNNMAMSTSGCSNFSLFNLFFLFVRRDMLLQSLSILTVIKMSCMSFTMYIFLENVCKPQLFFGILLSVAYGISGFALSYYITNQWLDVAVFLPLIMYGVYRILNGKRAFLYIACMSLALMASYYLSFMILFYVLLGTGFYIFFLMRENKEKIFIRQSLCSLSFATAGSILLSAFIVLPQLLQTFGSGRFQGGVNMPETETNSLLQSYWKILSQVKGAYTTRWWTLLGLSLAFAIIAIGIYKSIKSKKNWKAYRKSFNAKVDGFVIVMLLVMLLELFLESVNLMWHFGSYVHYPIRNGFLISFTVLAAASIYTGNWKFSLESGKALWKRIPICVLPVLVIGGCLYYYSQTTGLQLKGIFRLSALICLLFFLCYLGLLLISKKWNAAMLTGCLLIMELILYSFVLFGKPAFTTGYWESPEQEGDFIRKSTAMETAFSLQPSHTSRVKNPDTTLNANYPLVLRQPAMSNWTHIIAPAFSKGAAAFGYTVQYTRLLDAGGTVFSDALIGIRHMITSGQTSERLYEKKDTWEDYTLYETKYNLPWGMTVSDELLDVNIYEQSWIENQNSMYRLLSQDSEALLEPIQADRFQKQGDMRTAQIDIKGTKALYFSAGEVDAEDRHIKIFVNEQPISVSSIGEPENTAYPAYFNNNVVSLGVFENETITIAIQSMDEEAVKKLDEQLYVAELDLKKLSDLCESYDGYDVNLQTGARSMRLTVDNKESGKLVLLPVKYDNGWRATINGSKVTPIMAAGIFTALPLEQGENEIEMTFFPVGMKAGILISAMTLLITMVLYLKKVTLPKGIFTMVSSMFLVVWILVFLAMYVIPVLSVPFTFIL